MTHTLEIKYTHHFHPPNKENDPLISLGRHFSGRRRPFEPLHRGGHVRQDLRGHRDQLRGVRAREHHQLAERILKFRYKQPQYY